MLQGLPDSPNRHSSSKLAVLARAYSNGYLDLIVISDDITPMWAVSGGQDDFVVSDMDAIVLECLHLQGSVENGTSDSKLSQQPLWPTLLTDPLETWSLYVVLPFGLVSVQLEWASYLETVISKMERKFECDKAQQRRRSFIEGRDCVDESMDEERLSLRDALANRPKR